MALSLFKLAVLACATGASARRFKIRQFNNATTSSIEEPCTSSVQTSSTHTFSTFSWANSTTTVPVTSSSDPESTTSDVLPTVTLTPSDTPIVTGSATSTDSSSATESSSADSTELPESTANPGSTGSNASGTASTTSGAGSTHASVTTSQPAVTSSASVTEMTTSTVYATTVRTITKCPDWVPNCPHPTGHVTTEFVPLYTTVCPVTRTSKGSNPPKPTYPPSHGSETLTTTYHTTYTITKCPPSVPNCPVGSVTTGVVTTTYCPGKGEPVPTAPGGEHPTAPGGEYPTGPVAEHPTGPTAESPAVPTVTLEQPKPSAPVVEQPPAEESQTSHYTAPTAHHSTVGVPAYPSGFNSTSVPNKPSSTSTPPSTTAPVSGGVKAGVSVMALLGAMLVMM